MKKIITLATAAFFLLGLQSARAQREVQPPPIPPMLEGDRPLVAPETSKEPTAPKKVAEEKAKPRAKEKSKAKGKSRAAAKTKKKEVAHKHVSKKKNSKLAKKKSSKATTKTKRPAAKRAAPKGPEES